MGLENEASAAAARYTSPSMLSVDLLKLCFQLFQCSCDASLHAAAWCRAKHQRLHRHEFAALLRTSTICQQPVMPSLLSASSVGRYTCGPYIAQASAVSQGGRSRQPSSSSTGCWEKSYRSVALADGHGGCGGWQPAASRFVVGDRQQDNREIPEKDVKFTQCRFLAFGSRCTSGSRCGILR